MVTDTAVCNFADDTTIFAADCQLDKVLERLESDALILSKWFPENFMKLNAGKCHLLTFGTNQDDIQIKIGEAIVKESSEEKLLRVIIDKNLTKHNLNPSSGADSDGGTGGTCHRQISKFKFLENYGLF